MPWSSNDDLPQTVRGSLSDSQQTIFRQVANNVLARGLSEEAAFRMGWAASQRHGKKVATLYLQRKLKNAEDLVAWAKAQGCKKVLDPDEMHVTIAHSKQPVEWPSQLYNDELRVEGDKRSVEGLGPNGTAVVLKFKEPLLTARWDEMRVRGASWDFASYMPHITISYSGENLELIGTAPYDGVLILGPEEINEVNEDWADTVTEKRIVAKVSSVSDELGIVFGWAIVSKIRGEPYFDLQGDYIPEQTVLKAGADFMAGDRLAADMHQWDGDTPVKIGNVIFAFPLTSDIAKAMSISTGMTGLMVGMKVEDPAILTKFKSGQYTGFSIGGYRIKDEEVIDG